MSRHSCLNLEELHERTNGPLLRRSRSSGAGYEYAADGKLERAARGVVKVYQVYNESRAPFGGDAVVVDATMRILTQHGHQPKLVLKSSKNLNESFAGRLKTFWSGIYNIAAFREMLQLLQQDRPDIVHIHGVYPMFSPSILVACRRANVPVVMTVHDQRLTCPTGFHLYHGRVCEDCVGGHEFRCVLKNCRDNLPESAAYALRSAIARRFRLFSSNVATLIVMTPFAKDKLLQAGFRDDQIVIVPNPTGREIAACSPSQGKYVAFAGRLNREKGVEVLLAAAAQAPDIPFKIAGDGPLQTEIREAASKNVEVLGRLTANQLPDFYRHARVLVVPSLCFETFGMVVVEAMACGVPVIASRIGSLPYVVDEGINGALFEPGNSVALLKELRCLWENPDLAYQMGTAARRKVIAEYSEDVYYRGLMEAYQTTIQRARSNAPITRLVHINNAVPSSSEVNGR